MSEPLKLICSVCGTPFESAEFVAPMIFVNGARYVTSREWRLPCGDTIDDSMTEWETDHQETVVRDRLSHEVLMSWIEGNRR